MFMLSRYMSLCDVLTDKVILNDKCSDCQFNLISSLCNKININNSDNGLTACYI